MYLYQPNRILLDKQIKKYSHYIKGKVLDAGAGSYSRYIDFFKYQEYVKMDIEAGENVNIVGRAENIPFESDTFDSIVCTQVLGDIKEPLSAIREFYRVLKSGGAILLTEGFFNEMHDEPNDFWRFTKFGLEHLFLEANFKVISIDQRGGFFSTMAQSNIRYLINKFNLYDYSLSKLLSPVFKIYSEIMFFFDKIDKSDINKKFTLGWCIIAKK